MKRINAVAARSVAGLIALSLSAAHPAPRRRMESAGGGQAAARAGAVNVRQFGATGDGKSDDTKALQEAFAAANAASGNVFFPAGVYLVRQTAGSIFALTADGLNVTGEGIGKSVIRMADGVELSGDINVFQLNGKQQSIQSLSIVDGAGMSGPHNYIAIAIRAGATFPLVRDVEISGAYGSGTAGGAGITLYRPPAWPEVSTMQAAATQPGEQTVYPASMAGIYAGERLFTELPSEEVVVTDRTGSAFTAAFRQPHPAGSVLVHPSNSSQFATIENCIIHDAYQATGIVVNSSGNVIRNNKFINIGATPRQHGLYIQGGYNRIEDNYFEGIYGYSIHAYKHVPGVDGSGDVYIGNVSVDPHSFHMIIDSIPSDGSNPEVPDHTPLTRYAVVQGNVFRRTRNSGGGGGVSIGVPASITGNVFEDAVDTYGGDWLRVASGSTVTGNTLLVTNSRAGFRSGGISTTGGSDIVIADNQLIDEVSGNAGGAIRIENSSRVSIAGNVVRLTGAKAAGAAIWFNGPVSTDVDIAGNTLTVAGKAVCFALDAGTQWTAHDNWCSQTQSGDVVDLHGGPGAFYDNTLATGVFRYGAGVHGVSLYNNQGLFAALDGGHPIFLRRAAGRLLEFRKSGTALVAGTLAMLNPAGELVTASRTSAAFAGFVIADSGLAPGAAYIAGQTGTEFDGALVDGPWKIGHYGVPSRGETGRLHDAGGVRPAGSYVVFLDSGTAAGSARVLIGRTF